jgi:hypothetical protein
MNNFKIRKLERTDAQEFQRLRLFALQNNPTSFGSSFEEENKKSLGNRPLEPRALEVEFFPLEEVLHAKVKIH